MLIHTTSTPALSAPSARVSTVTLDAHPRSPHGPGATIQWKASATGGGAKRQYKWFVYDGSRWTPASKWSTNDTFLWTPLTANPRYRIAVWARSASSISDDFEACAEVGLAIIEN
jgi:hypothetical protein